jgi:hypothetical protein
LDAVNLNYFFSNKWKAKSPVEEGTIGVKKVNFISVHLVHNQQKNIETMNHTLSILEFDQPSIFSRS